jgi:hypothetical protein
LVTGLLFTDSKPLTPTLGKKTTNGASNYISNKLILIWLIKGDDTKLEELLKPLENRLKTLQTTVKELQADTTLIVETLTVIKGQVSKAVAETILPLEDWVKLRSALKDLWPTKKGYSEQDMKEIIENKLGLDTDTLENSGVVKTALDKMKNYLRGTLFKTFESLVNAAITHFYRNNSAVKAEDIQSHCTQILELRKWTKSNATDSDIDLAKDLIMEELKARVKVLSETSADSDAEDIEHPFKKRRLNKSTAIHPAAKMKLPTTRPIEAIDKEDV